MFETISGFSDILQAIWGVLISIELNDIIDIAVLSFLIYHFFKLVRETRAMQLVQGILLLVAFYLISILLELQTIRYILKTCFQWGLVAIVVLFQPELRRMIATLGRTRISDLSFLPRVHSANGEEACAPYEDVLWWPQNWRKGGLQERRGEIIKEMDFYNQLYCGCEFSMSHKRDSEAEMNNFSK